MIKGLETLKEIVDYAINEFTDNEKKYQKDLEIIEKELKALEIIKEDFFTFIDFKEEKRETKTYYFIDFNRGDYRVYLPKEKLDLLKEVLL